MPGILDARVLVVWLALDHLAMPYLWGGDGVVEAGADCSGFSGLVFTGAARFYPQLYDGQRRTAQGQLDYWRGRGCPMVTMASQLIPGMPVFFHRGAGHITHVKIHLAAVPPIRARAALGSEMVSLPVGPVAIDAGGGGSKTTTPREALKARAAVSYSASDHHGGLEWVAVDPIGHLLKQ